MRDRRRRTSRSGPSSSSQSAFTSGTRREEAVAADVEPEPVPLDGAGDAADPVLALDDDDRMAGADELERRGEPGWAAADDDGGKRAGEGDVHPAATEDTARPGRAGRALRARRGRGAALLISDSNRKE